MRRRKERGPQGAHGHGERGQIRGKEGEYGVGLEGHGEELLDVGLEALGGAPPTPGLKLGGAEAEVEESGGAPAAEPVPGKIAKGEGLEEGAGGTDGEEASGLLGGLRGEIGTPRRQESRHWPPVGGAGALRWAKAQGALVKVGSADGGSL